MFAQINQREAVKRLAWQYLHPNQFMGLSTGFKTLDGYLRGLEPGDVIVIGARPQMGKSQMLNAIAWNTVSAGHSAFYWQFEMSDTQTAFRIATSLLSLPPSAFEDHYYFVGNQRIDLTAADFTNVKNTLITVSQAPLYISTGVKSIDQMREELHKAVSEDGLPAPKLLIVDYVQLMASSNPRSSYDATTANIVALKTLAAQYGCPILVASQLSRGVEGRENKRPVLSDLEGSGRLEQVAQVVMLLYRSDYYARQEDPAAGLTHGLEVNIAKQQRGPTGTVKLWYNTTTQELCDYDMRKDVPLAEPAPLVNPATGEILDPDDGDLF